MKSIAFNLHDHNTYDGNFHRQMERFSRTKMNVYKGSHEDFYNQYVKPYFNHDLFAFTYTGGGFKDSNFKVHPLENELKQYASDIKSFRVSNLWDYYYKDNIYYIDHHQSHAAYALIASQYESADILAIDGGGSYYCTILFDVNGKATNLSEDLPLGWLWNIACHQAGLEAHEPGKLMGLSGYGEFNQHCYDFLEILIDERKNRGKFHPSRDILKNVNPKDIAFTMQQFTYDKIKEIVLPLKTSNNICVAGGCAYNGYMNEMLTQYYDNVYVPPAPGDEGQSLGTYMHADYILNNNIHLPELYAGKEYDLEDNEIDYHQIAQMIADGKIVGWFQGRSESGNRALGNRSILADPRNPNIKDIINQRIKKREDWRPFAPSVLEEKYQEYFDTQLPSPYMSRIANVKSEEIPGVTHVDNTARIQTVTQQQNEKYHKLISAFYDITGIPMVLNTSFNCQEPIVETPKDAMKTFHKTELDMLVLGSEVIIK